MNRQKIIKTNREILEREIITTNTQIMHEALSNASKLAKRGVTPELLTPYISSIQSSYTTLIARVKSCLQAETEKAQGERELEDAGRVIHEYQQGITTLEEEKESHQENLNRIIDTYNWAGYRFSLVGEAVLIAGETALNVGAFSMLNILIFSVLISAVFSTALTIAAVAIPYYIKRLQTEEERVKAFIGVAFGMLIVFTAISTLRAAVTVGNGTFQSLSKAMIGPIVLYTVLNSFVFACAVGLAYGFPTQEERTAKRLRYRYTKNIKKLDKQIQRIQTEAKHLHAQVGARMNEREAIIGLEAHLVARIEALRDECTAAFTVEYQSKIKPAN